MCWYQRGVVVDASVSINEVALHRVRLSTEQVTDCLWAGKPSRYVTSHL